MKKIHSFFFTILAAILVFGCENKTAQNEATQDQLINAVLWYQHAEEMQAIYYQSFNWAKYLLDQKMNEQEQEQDYAVIVDIDETMLDNSPYEAWCILNNESYSSESWKKWTSQASADALPGAVAFTHFADSLGVEVFYISNRHISETDATIENLIKEGFAFANREHLLLKDTTSNKDPRRNTVSNSHEILLLMGDNLGDFDHVFDHRENQNALKNVRAMKEKFGFQFIVLPNPMYGKWERAIVNDIPEGSTHMDIRKKALKSFTPSLEK